MNILRDTLIADANRWTHYKQFGQIPNVLEVVDGTS